VIKILGLVIVTEKRWSKEIGDAFISGRIAERLDPLLLAAGAELQSVQRHRPHRHVRVVGPGR
jgi:hypothetical protein